MTCYDLLNDLFEPIVGYGFRQSYSNPDPQLNNTTALSELGPCRSVYVQ